MTAGRSGLGLASDPRPWAETGDETGHDDLELLSFRGVAKLLHCHRDRVADLVATGALKSIPVGRGLRRVPRWALREYQLSLVGAR